MTQHLDTDRLVFGGSLYPPADVPVRYSRRVSALIILAATVAAWAIVMALVWGLGL
jgi:hypothetical protein